MTHLIMLDGTTRAVDYNKAAKIFQILDGTAKPDNKEQAAFVKTVKEVKFDQLVRRKIERRTIEHDSEMDKILANTKLKGREKVRAIAARLKERIS